MLALPFLSPPKSKKGQKISIYLPKIEVSEEICEVKPWPRKSLLASHRLQSREYQDYEMSGNHQVFDFERSILKLKSHSRKPSASDKL